MHNSNALTRKHVALELGCSKAGLERTRFPRALGPLRRPPSSQSDRVCAYLPLTKYSDNPAPLSIHIRVGQAVLLLVFARSGIEG